MTRFYECVIAAIPSLSSAEVSELGLSIGSVLCSAGAQGVVFVDWGRRSLAWKLSRLDLVWCFQISFKSSSFRVLDSLRKAFVFDSRVKRWSVYLSNPAVASLPLYDAVGTSATT
ncbi:MAG: 30S ribosomal protein S6 [Candidatus Hodgkinia cicadicola]